jgi:hypothetical protein
MQPGRAGRAHRLGMREHKLQDVVRGIILLSPSENGHVFPASNGEKYTRAFDTPRRRGSSYVFTSTGCGSASSGGLSEGILYTAIEGTPATASCVPCKSTSGARSAIVDATRAQLGSYGTGAGTKRERTCPATQLTRTPAQRVRSANVTSSARPATCTRV